MILENIEGLTEWNIPAGWHKNRKPGLSAMVRVKDEAEFCIPSLNSILGWCDEIVIALQGEQTDGTDRLITDWADGRSGVRVLFYPFDSVPNGPGHDNQKRGSVYERAYFYNWTLAQTTRTYAMKWDLDMVALPGLGDGVRRLMEEGASSVRFKGVDLVSLDPPVMSVRPYTANEARVFRVTPDTYFSTGQLTEQFTIGHNVGPGFDAPMFLHFKWVKKLESATKAWPRHWRDCPHFQRVYGKHGAGGRYEGPWPEALRG